MRTAPIPASHSYLLVTAVAFFIGVGSGCTAVTQHVTNWCDSLYVYSQKKHELADVRHDTRRALSQQEQEALRKESERSVEQARLDAERRILENELCIANQEALQRRAKNQIKNVMESKLAFNFEQEFEVGELQVDIEALKKLIEEREKEQPPTTSEDLRTKKPCSCCDQPCNCGSGLLRRLCPKCRHKSCEAEKTCGGPEALRKLEQEPLKRPLRPTEIPLILPVKMQVGIQRPEMEGMRIRRQPNGPTEDLRRPCDDGGPCDHDGPCDRRGAENANGPCTDPGKRANSGMAPPPARVQPPSSETGETPSADNKDASLILPPIPELDTEAAASVSPRSAPEQRVRVSPASARRIPIGVPPSGPNTGR